MRAGVQPPPRGAQIDGDVLQALIALARILSQTLVDDALDVGADVRQDAGSEARQPRRRLVEDGTRRLDAAPALERQPPGEHLVQENAE